MKLTAKLVREFESDQKTHGTKTALFNLLWHHASTLMRNLGVTKIKTTNPKE